MPCRSVNDKEKSVYTKSSGIREENAHLAAGNCIWKIDLWHEAENC